MQLAQQEKFIFSNEQYFFCELNDLDKCVLDSYKHFMYLSEKSESIPWKKMCVNSMKKYW